MAMLMYEHKGGGYIMARKFLMFGVVFLITLLLYSCVDEVEKEPSILNKDSLTILGEGEKMFYFSVFDSDGNERKAQIYTDCETVGDALIELDLIAGESSEYGLYVKSVDGITLDYAEDGKYWAFYVDQDYAMTGVDSTEIEYGMFYSFRAEE